MKRTVTSSKPGKLSLNYETVRILTSQELSVVAGGACQKGSVKTQVVPPQAHNETPAAWPPTC
jgi:hypothetical protein